MKASHPLLLLLMTGLAAGTWWLANRDATQRSTRVDSSAAVGDYINEPLFEQTDARGQLTLRIEAQQARETDTEGTVDLLAPVIRYFPQGHSDWLLHAQHGSLPPDRNILTLNGDVAMEAVSAGSATGAIAHTDRLTLDINRERASTNSPVALEFAKNKLIGEGMQADLKAGTLALQSKVHGSFTR